MLSARSQTQSYRRRYRDARGAVRRFWIDLALACLAGVILALTVATISSQGSI